MAFVTESSPNAGDDFGDWLITKLLPFCRDNMGWTDNQVPSGSPDLSLGNATSELWIHRGGAAQIPNSSPISGSPLNTSPRAEPPFVFLRSQDGNRGYLFTGFGGTDASQEIYDQPDNPANSPRVITFNWQTSREECQIIPGLDGPFTNYWLFGSSDGSYCHAVIQISARDFRHMWFGLLDRFSSDVDPDSFYICGHWWNGIDGSIVTAPGSNSEHDPYDTFQIPPGRPGVGTQTVDGIKQQNRSVLYSPGLRTTGGSPDEPVNWFYSLDDTGLQSLTKPVGDVHTTRSDIGCCAFTSYGNTLGRALVACDESFTANVRPLVPILVFVNTEFGGQERWGCVGKVPDVYRFNMREITPASEIVIGSDTYVVFPVANNDSANVLSGEPYSGYEGFAYKKILGSP